MKTQKTFTLNREDRPMNVPFLAVATLTALLCHLPTGKVAAADAANEVISYPTADPRSETFSVTAAGSPVPVIRYADVDYVHFACSRPTELVIRRLDGQSTRVCRVRPEHLGIRSVCDGSVVRVTVSPGQQLVVNVDYLRKLFVFAEKPEPQRGTGKPTAVVNAVARGADPTGKTDSTKAIQRAIDELPAGGVLSFPPGCYRSGSLDLKSNMTLHLEGGALLKGSDDHQRFKRYKNRSYLYFLLADGVENVHITGRGTIDANGFVVRAAWQKERGVRKQAGRALLGVNCRRIEIRDIILRDSFSWMLHLVECNDSELRNVKVLADTRNSNGDGLDIDACRRVNVIGCFLYAEDDAISVKAGWSESDPQDLVFRDCVLWSQNATGIRIGTETRSEAFQRLVFENLSILRSNTVVRIFCYDGANIDDVVFRNIHAEELSLHVPAEYVEFRRISEVGKGVTYLLQFLVRKGKEKKLGSIRNVVCENFDCLTAAGSKFKGYDAAPGTILIDKVTIRNFRIAGELIRAADAGRFSVNENVAHVRFETTD